MHVWRTGLTPFSVLCGLRGRGVQAGSTVHRGCLLVESGEFCLETTTVRRFICLQTHAVRSTIRLGTDILFLGCGALVGPCVDLAFQARHPAFLIGPFWDQLHIVVLEAGTNSPHSPGVLIHVALVCCIALLKREAHC